MDPIGASDTWHWEAYDYAWVEINGRKMKSVTGGGHFGGGMFINATTWHDSAISSSTTASGEAPS